nr:VOC family protein [Brachybacterium alimentarium]
MITSVASAILYVSDQDSALEFYRDVLGFDVVMDAEMEEDSRWLEVRPSGAQTSLVLAAAAAFGKQPGEGAYLTFAADDVAATVEQLRARGARTS